MFGWFKKKKSFKTIHCVAYLDPSGDIVIKGFYSLFDAVEYYGTLSDLIDQNIEIHYYPVTLS
jgi:hypothetical protein